MVGTRSKKNTRVESPHESEQNEILSTFDLAAESIGLKVMKKQISELTNEERDDFDYYEPTKELEQFSKDILFTLEDILEFSNESRDPSEDDAADFKYVEISSIDIATGEIIDYNTIPCDEELVPSRARKVIHENDIIISTVRPTRRAIAKVPKYLENEICSTGFEVVRPKNGIDVDYILYILRTPLVGKQFGKFASGSSYPAISEKHIQMTQVPIPSVPAQKIISEKMNQTISKVKLLHNEISEIVKDFETESTEILQKEKHSQLHQN